ncbi:MAG: hypothetical protein SGJ18_05565 [Pseudomonadota bacterium]|nr:hypothetical protein [Pseudomonadota bacterium]
MQICFFLALLFPLIGLGKTIVLNKGATTTLEAPKNKKIHAHSKKTIEVTDLGSRILMRGKNEGDTFITIGGEDTPVVVLEPAKYIHYQNLVAIIGTMEGLSINPSSKALFIEGELLRTSDWDLIAKLKIPADFLRFSATIHPLIKDEVQAHLKKLLRNHHLPISSINIEKIPEILVAKGSKDLRVSLSNVMGPYGISVSTSDSEIETAPMVRTKIVVASISKSHLMDIGIKWPISYSAQLLPKVALKKNITDIDFQFLEKNGWGKVLASPTLLCRSGKEASFLSGGEFPIRIINIRTKDISWKKYGVQVKLRPLADYNGKMSINLETEVSSLDHDNSLDGIPALQTNRISSHFDLTSTRTIALSGLIVSESGNSREGLPGFSSIPLVGRLFGSDSYKERQTELVIFVTPEVVFPENELSEDKPEDNQENQLPPSWNNSND